MRLKSRRMLALAGIISLLSAFWVVAADQHGTTLNASVKSVDKTTKTVTLSIDTMHDITSFIKHGDEVEIVLEADTASTSDKGQKRSWRLQRSERPMIQGQ